jgi:hypothetical protein
MSWSIYVNLNLLFSSDIKCSRINTSSFSADAMEHIGCYQEQVNNMKQELFACINPSLFLDQATKNKFATTRLP